jgi:hypothetical protein
MTGRKLGFSSLERAVVTGIERRGVDVVIVLGHQGFGKLVIGAAQLSMLLDGIEWRMPLRTWRPLTSRSCGF